MATKNLVYPDKHASLRILNELFGFFSQFVFVNRIFVFGSHARNEWDCWSDIDMLVVTNGGLRQQWQLFDNLKQHKAILHHHTFTPKTEPSGSNVLGIVFEDESVFHNLDLNFMTVQEFQSANSLDRFGHIKPLYLTKQNESKGDKAEFSPTFEVDFEERKIGMGIHWTKKAIKRVLRREDCADVLVQSSIRLKEIMQEFPEDRPMLGGNICYLARIYLQISDLVLEMNNRRQT